MRSLLVSVLLVASAAVPLTLIACSGGSDATSDSAEADLSATRSEGAACGAAHKCKKGLVCKPSSAPPPGALGMPVSSSSPANHPVLGMPIPADNGTCQKPDPGEEGGSCSATVDCNPGLTCDYGDGSSAGGDPPPGALGMPVPTSTATHHFPPGALGMPIPTSSGSARRPVLGMPIPTSSSTSHAPPGALGMPVPTSSASHPTMGMPIQRTGTCKADSSGGPPPGALGMPVPTH